MTVDNLESRLAELDNAFKSASEPDMSGLPEPGTYQCLLKEVDFFEAKKTGAAFLKLIYEVVHDPKYAGANISMIYNLEPQKLEGAYPASKEEIEQKLGFLKRDLRKLGVDVDGPDFTLGLVRPGSPIWDPILDSPVEIDVRDSKKVNPETGKPYRNAYLNAKLGGPVKPDIPIPDVEPLPVAAKADDDLPF